MQVALAWLSTTSGAAVGEPWPLRSCDDVCDAVASAAYLDAPRLVRAAVRSWSLGAERAREEQLRVAGAIVEATLQFEDSDQELVIFELRQLLHNLPKHQLVLAPEFLAAPAAGLEILEARQVAKETLMGHMKQVGEWVGSVMGRADGGDHRSHSGTDPEAPLSSSEFAVRLLDRHRAYFLARRVALRQLLGHVDVSTAISPPLCFGVASAALAASSALPGDLAGDASEPFPGRAMAVEIFERSVGAVEFPAEAAADPSCVNGLFGAGGRTLGDDVLALDVLARPLVPPAAASVVLSRVLSSWGAIEACSCTDQNGCEGGDGSDAADVILAGVASDRQKLRLMLQQALPRIAEESDPAGSDWGTSFDYAVPELRAAFARAVSSASSSPSNRGASSAAAGEEVAMGGSVVVDDTVRLLFRVLFQPTGGLPGVAFPLSLFGELRGHNAHCRSLAARCAVARLREMFAFDPRRAWRVADSVWPTISWDDAEESLLEDVVAMLRSWLIAAKRAPSAAPAPVVEAPGRDNKAEAKLAVVRLLAKLPLHRLSNTEHLLGPPVPAHVLALLAQRGVERDSQRISALEAENERLRSDVSRLQAELRRA
mmetsp:Transcript_145961/g.467971  ORF Transcript_145961/g.467971 Transcript_145961/m.467971 type:complete len:600 (-) Transcript_145961:92-1891(-)